MERWRVGGGCGGKTARRSQMGRQKRHVKNKVPLSDSHLSDLAFIAAVAWRFPADAPHRHIYCRRGMVVTQIWLLLFGGLGLGALLDIWAGHKFPIVFYLALGGSFVSYIYSAPPLKLKQNGWIGNFALGASYISLPWWAGQALFGTLNPDIIVLTLLYSIAGFVDTCSSMIQHMVNKITVRSL